ncbi:ParA family protein [Lysinibacillus antri]|uniref:ParA family protein n=1 Tax=Lysinibacillus antri TaxID=2498145 RepID=A0A3S0P3K7_9BACI|nr:AAA family ATPase [Lysinibacillus antri]RUL47440.1 ParA family protein [Lysinibacillus antri]
MKKNEEAVIVTFGNFKGGTGKTTNSTMIAHALAEMGYKVLLCDQDPQANATTLFLKTKALLTDEIVAFNKTLMAAIQDEELGQIVTEIKENLYLLPSFSDFAFYPRYLEKKFPSDTSERVKYFSTLIQPLKKDYDFIFIDVPPTISIITDAALYASDYVVVVLQTQERSLQGAEVFTSYLQSLIDDYDATLDIIGILPVLLKNGAAVDLATLENARQIFGVENLFTNVVNNMERLKRFDITGITNEDIHDRKVHRSYETIAKEFLNRLEAELAEVNGVEQLTEQSN